MRLQQLRGRAPIVVARRASRVVLVRPRDRSQGSRRISESPGDCSGTYTIDPLRSR